MVGLNSLDFKRYWLADLRKDADAEFLKDPAFEAFALIYFCLEKLEKAKRRSSKVTNPCRPEIIVSRRFVSISSARCCSSVFILQF